MHHQHQWSCFGRLDCGDRTHVDGQNKHEVQLQFVDTVR